MLKYTLYNFIFDTSSLSSISFFQRQYFFYDIDKIMSFFSLILFTISSWFS